MSAPISPFLVYDHVTSSVLDVLRPTPHKPNTPAGLPPTVLTDIVADIQPLDDPPLDLSGMPGVQDTSKFIWFHIFITLDDNPQLDKLPDIRNGDQLQDQIEVDYITGNPAIYYIKRAAPWWGDHIEIHAQRLASTPAPGSTA